MNRFLFCFLTSLILTGVAHAEVCITQMRSSMSEEDFEGSIQEATLRCQEISLAKESLEAIDITLEAGSVVTACAGIVAPEIGLPATVILGGTKIGLRILSMQISKLPCTNASSPAEIRGLVYADIEAALVAMGVDTRALRNKVLSHGK